MNDRQIKLNARATIHSAMKSYRAESYVEPSKITVGYDDYTKISRLQLDQGMIALILECNLVGGSAGDVDLYRLVAAYLHNKEARAEINGVMERHEF